MKLEITNNWKSILIYLIKNISLLILSIILAWLVSSQVGYYFCKITECGGSWVDTTSLIGLMISYPFFLSLVFTLTNNNKKYLWSIGAFIGIFIIFGFYEMPEFFLKFTVPPFLAGWFIGILVYKLKPRIPERT